MRKRNITIWVAMAALLGIGGSALGLPLQIEWTDGPQDPLALPTDVHELGVFFPVDEAIITVDLGIIPQTACFDGSDDQGVPNFLVQMTNVSPHTWYDVYYVADPETIISNFDGTIGHLGTGFQTSAFRIDNVGINRPLIYESMISDNIFQPGETWEFIIQDYLNFLGGPPSALDSPGIAGNSSGWPLSTGSIVAVIPEPSFASLLLVGLFGILGIRRR